jgi:hypothetical protein
MDILESIYEIGLSELKKQNSDNDILDTNRCIVEPYIYQYLMESYGPMLKKHWQTYKPPKKSDHVFVIAERRAHPNFRFILYNIAWAGPNMAVYLFCSDQNQRFIETLLGDKKDHYHIIPIFAGNPTRDQGKQAYNTVLTDYRFYERIDATYMLTIQMDNFIRKKIDPNMFVGDYWGNPWSWNPNAAGGGGATVRRVAAMIELCRTYQTNPNGICNEAEDIWISNRVITYPPLEFRQNYLMESIVMIDPYIVHQFWTFLDQYIRLVPREECITYFRTLLTIQ